MSRPDTLVIALLFMLALPRSASAYWIWTPETGKWINPKHSVKESAGEQLAWAMSFYETEDYARAKNEFAKLVKYYQDSPEAPQAQCYEGMSYEMMGYPYKAYEAYVELIDRYPASEWVEKAIEQEYRMGETFLSGARRKYLGVKLPWGGKDAAVEIFRKVVEQAPYGAFGDKAQYKLGEALMERKRFAEAIGEFEKLIREYPESPLVESGRYQIALASSRLALKPSYDQQPAREAIEHFREAVESEREEKEKEEARRILSELEEKRAEKDYRTAQFYEKQNKKMSALIYYRSVISQGPDTSWADLARQRIEKLEGAKDE